MAGISREHLNRIGNGKGQPHGRYAGQAHGSGREIQSRRSHVPAVRLCAYPFPHAGYTARIRDILKLNIDYMLHEDYGHYKYTEHYYLGDVFVYTSQDEEKGTLLELKGKAVASLKATCWHRGVAGMTSSWTALVEGGVMKRLDLAINDRAGILDIPDLTAKCNREECVSLFRSFKSLCFGGAGEAQRAGQGGHGTHAVYRFSEIGSLLLLL